MALKSWFHIPPRSHFSLANLPLGIISYGQHIRPRPAFGIGDYCLDLEIFTAQSGFKNLSVIQPHSSVFAEPTLNAFAALDRGLHDVVRKYVQSVFLLDTPYPEILKDNTDRQKQCLVPRESVKMHLPMHIGDYTDFYAGLNHARNCGIIFRGPENALQPNYKFLPVGYHGRASSIVVSGTPIRRPWGQVLADPSASVKKPVVSPSKRLDIELELAAFICKPSHMGEQIRVNDAAQHIFGFVLMNDWSARDLQGWEAVPLGPFCSKNFGTTISPWVVMYDAIDKFRTTGISNDVELSTYLLEAEKNNVYDINLEVELTTSSGHKTILSKTNSRNLLFSFPQMLAHHTFGGCPFAVGDLLGSGTISGTSPDTLGSMLERSKGGREAFDIGDGQQRLFLEDGDQVTFRGCCGQQDDGLVGFGECSGLILPARQEP